MRMFIFSIGMILSSYGFTQFDTTSYDKVFHNRGEAVEFVFGDLSESLYPTGFLLDKYEYLEDKWEKYCLSNDNSISSVFSIDNWFELYSILSKANNDGGDITDIIEINYKMIDHLFSGNGRTETALNLPVILLDYKVNRIKEKGVENGNILFEENKFIEGSNPEQGIEENSLFFAGLWLDTLEHTEINITFDDYYIQSNRSSEIIGLNVSFQGMECTLFEGGNCLLTNIPDGDNIVNFETYFGDGSIVSSSFSFFARPKTKSINVTNNELTLFDQVATAVISAPLGDEDTEHPSATWCVKYSCTNNSGAIRKPVIFVAGFGMGSPFTPLTSAGQTDCAELYVKYNIEGLCDDLLSKGHDVIIVRFVPAVADIVMDAQLLTNILTDINSNKMNNGSYFENVIIGYSAGALVSRYALDQMEKNHLEFGAPHPHTKLYTSFEGEHNGAYIPVGAQIALDHFNANYFTIKTFVIHYMANSPQAKQLLKYFRTETPLVGNGNSPGQGAHPDRFEFLNKMESEDELGHDKQYEKYGYYGFPAFSRNISIANGSYQTNTGSGFAEVQNEPYFYEPGHTVFYEDGTWNTWFVGFGNNTRVNNSLNNYTTCRILHKNIWGNTVLDLNYKTSPEYVMWGNAPGGFLFDKEDMQKTIFQKMKNNIGAEIYDYLPVCFTPTISNHAIRNYDPTIPGGNYDSFYPYHVVYNFQEELLMGINKNILGDVIQGDFFGYPNLGHSLEHYSITPFEAIYTDVWNQTHISSLNSVITTPVYPDVDDMLNSGYVTIKTFIMDEIEPTVAYLQNRQIGWNTNGENYKTQYEAKYAIFIGEEVTPKTDVAPYEILNNGDLSCLAENSIIIKSGFHAQAGALFHASIGSVAHASCPAPSYLSVQNDEYLNEVHFEEQVSDQSASIAIEEVEDYGIIPNPTSIEKGFLLKSSNNDLVSIKLIDVSGKLVFNGLVYPNKVIYPNLTAGVYVLLIDDGINQTNQKLVVN